MSSRVRSMSASIRGVSEGVGTEEPIPLPNVSSMTLGKVLEFCKYHVDSPDGPEAKAWDAEFMRVDEQVLFELILVRAYAIVDCICLVTHMWATSELTPMAGAAGGKLHGHQGVARPHVLHGGDPHKG